MSCPTPTVVGLAVMATPPVVGGVGLGVGRGVGFGLGLGAGGGGGAGVGEGIGVPSCPVTVTTSVVANICVGEVLARY